MATPTPARVLGDSFLNALNCDEMNDQRKRRLEGSYLNIVSAGPHNWRLSGRFLKWCLVWHDCWSSGSNLDVEVEAPLFGAT